jgi:hypothetical protein
MQVMQHLLSVASKLLGPVRRLGGGTPLTPLHFAFDLLEAELGELAVHPFELEEGLSRCYSLKPEIVTIDSSDEGRNSTKKPADLNA